MSDPPHVEPIIDNPTYMGNIRDFFRKVDIDHMFDYNGMALGSYKGVKLNAFKILSRVTDKANPMPPKKDGGPWSPERIQTFQNWVKNKCPEGSATPATQQVESETATRQRKDVRALSDDEFTLLTTAFTGLMQREPTKGDSYFYIAGMHYLPLRWCEHHSNPFIMWHRHHLWLFEEALRSVPGCSEVTLPYWDISTDLPDRLQHPPFKQYNLPLDPGVIADPPSPTKYPRWTTSRYTVDEINQNVKKKRVLEAIANSLNQSMWGGYNDRGYQLWSIQAHDNGHDSIGKTMANQDISAFDPVFWFFHCNLDRLWLSWQTKVRATTPDDFLTTLEGNTDWLDYPLTAFDPPVTSREVIESKISYDRLDLPKPADAVTMENTTGSVPAERTFAIKSSYPVSVRVKGIDRLKIPGTFVVTLLADGEPLAENAFFQPTDPDNCETCAGNAVVNIDFRLSQDEIVDKALSVRIDVHGPNGDTRVPLSEAGDPTINARLLIEDM